MWSIPVAFCMLILLAAGELQTTASQSISDEADPKGSSIDSNLNHEIGKAVEIEDLKKADPSDSLVPSDLAQGPTSELRETIPDTKPIKHVRNLPHLHHDQLVPTHLIAPPRTTAIPSPTRKPKPGLRFRKDRKPLCLTESGNNSY
jgi:hypothetical protein